MIRIARQTLQAIDRIMKEDQGASFRVWEGKVLPHISDAYRGHEPPFRDHLGASILGGNCGRSIWLSWRWFTLPSFEGRTLRLFNRGHLEEGRFIALLLMIGCKVYQHDTNGKQYRVTFANGYGGGSGDGVAINLPDLPAGTPALVECKTHGEKSFNELAGPADEWRKCVTGEAFTGKGVREAKHEHYVQMQIYMARMGIPVGIYLATNKNTDDLYAEIVEYDSLVANQFLDRAEKLVGMGTPPPRINNSPGYYVCRFCDHRPVCHLKAEPQKNCRTCSHVRLTTGGVWSCGLTDKQLTPAEQRLGCPQHKKVEQ